MLFSDNFHGMGMQMTSNGTGIYYKPGIEWRKNTQILGDIGVHFSNHGQSASGFGLVNGNSSIYLDLSAVLKQELFRTMIAGVFKPVIIIQGGSIADLSTISGINNLGNWRTKYAFGTGIQFYNGRILNELILKFNKNPFVDDGNMAFQLAMYWK
tara:strand:+ start:106 stop:570 length:465 start_codon:yes stop_codon:yes gene_type:complete